MNIFVITLVVMIVFFVLSILSYILNFSVIQKQRKVLLELDEDKTVRQSEIF